MVHCNKLVLIPTIKIILLAYLSHIIASKLVYKYSHNEYLSQNSQTYSIFYQLTNGTIIGISEEDKFIFQQKSEGYVLDKENKFSINFTLDKASRLIEYSSYDGSLMIPCVKTSDNSVTNRAILAEIDLKTNTYKVFSNSMFQYFNAIEQNYCNIFNTSVNNLYYISYVCRATTGKYNGTCIYGFNNLYDNASIVDRFTVSGFSLSNDKEHNNCIVLKTNLLFCAQTTFSTTKTNRLLFTYLPLTLQGDNFFKMTVEKYGPFNIPFIDENNFHDFYLKKLRDEMGVIIIHDIYHQMFIMFIDYTIYFTIKNGYYCDQIPRKSNYENNHFYKINEDYFIIIANYKNSSNEESNLYFYLFEINLKSEINFPKINNFKSDFAYIFPSALESGHLFIVNQVLSSSLDIYEFTLNCKNILFLYDENNIIDIKKQILKEEEEENKNINNIFISIISLDQNNEINHELFGTKVDLSDGLIDENFEPVQVGTEYIYNKFKFSSNGVESIFTFKYSVLTVTKENFTFPSFSCNGIIEFKCFESCSKCLIAGDPSENNCLACKEGYYPLYEDSMILDQYNCYNKQPEGYYFEESLNVYHKCFHLCKSCNESGNDIMHNCLECNDGYKPLYFYTGKDNDINYCVKECDIYESRWYIDIFTKEYICLENTTSCPENYGLFDPRKGQCSYHIDIINETDIETSNDTKTDTKINNITLFSMDIETLLNILNNDPLTLLEETPFRINTSTYKLEINKINSSNYNEEENNISKYYDFSDCLKKLFDVNDSYIYISTLEMSNREYPTNQYEYEFIEANGKLIDLSICDFVIIKPTLNNFVNVDVGLAKKMKSENNIDIFDIKDQFFNDYCYTFTSDNDRDVTINDRIIYYYQNYSLCDVNCDYFYFNTTDEVFFCKCPVDNKMNPYLKKRNYTSNILEGNGILKKINDKISIHVLSCHKNAFTKENTKTFIFISLTSFVCVDSVIFILTNYFIYAEIKKKRLAALATKLNPVKKGGSNEVSSSSSDSCPFSSNYNKNDISKSEQKKLSNSNIKFINEERLSSLNLNNIQNLNVIQNSGNNVINDPKKELNQHKNILSPTNNKKIGKEEFINDNKHLILSSINNILENENLKHKDSNKMININSIKLNEERVIKNDNSNCLILNENVNITPLSKEDKKGQSNKININVQKLIINKKNIVNNNVNQVNKVNEQTEQKKTKNDLFIQFKFFGYDSKLFFTKQFEDMTFIQLCKNKSLIYTMFFAKYKNYQKIKSLLNKMTGLGYILLLLFNNALFYSDKYISKTFLRAKKFCFKDEFKKIIISFYVSVLVHVIFKVFNSFFPKNQMYQFVIDAFILLGTNLLLTFFIIIFCSVYVNTKSNLLICIAITLVIDIVLGFFNCCAIYGIRKMGVNYKSSFLFFVSEILYFI